MNPRGDVEGGLLWAVGVTYVRVWHRLRVRGRENCPPAGKAGPMVVVSNHTSGVDPALVQAACPFEIRWIMAEDMRHPWGEWLWVWARVIFVNRLGDQGRAGRGDSTGIRQSLRHLKRGGVLGIFPEGGIERPPRTIMPFMPGVGFLIARSGAAVLPVVVEGTPQIDPAWKSLHRRSHSVVEFKSPLDYQGWRPEAITRDLRERFIAWTGWPAWKDGSETGAATTGRPPEALSA